MQIVLFVVAFIYFRFASLHLFDENILLIANLLLSFGLVFFANSLAFAYGEQIGKIKIEETLDIKIGIRTKLGPLTALLVNSTLFVIYSYIVINSFSEDLFQEVWDLGGYYSMDIEMPLKFIAYCSAPLILIFLLLRNYAKQNNT